MKTKALFSLAVVAMMAFCVSCSSAKKTDDQANEQTQIEEVVVDAVEPIVEETPAVEIVVREEPQEIEFEGTLVMWKHNGEYFEKITEYPDTIEEFYAVCFVVASSEPIQVAPYLEEWEEVSDWVEPNQSVFMVVPQFEYTGREFAAQYAGKHVKVKGTLYVPMAGWRNATIVVMSLKDIQVVE
jgi:hypothetical protein